MARKQAKQQTDASEGTATQTEAKPEVKKGDMAKEAKETGKGKSKAISIDGLKAKTDAGTKAVKEAATNIANGLRAMATSEPAAAFAKILAVNGARISAYLPEIADKLQTGCDRTRKAIVASARKGLDKDGDSIEVTRSEQTQITKCFKVVTHKLPIAKRVTQEWDGDEYPAVVNILRDASDAIVGFLDAEGNPLNAKGRSMPDSTDVGKFLPHKFYLAATYDLLPKEGKPEKSLWDKFYKLMGVFGEITKLPNDATVGQMEEVRGWLTHLSNLLPAMQSGEGTEVEAEGTEVEGTEVEAVVTQEGTRGGWVPKPTPHIDGQDKRQRRGNQPLRNLTATADHSQRGRIFLS